MRGPEAGSPSAPLGQHTPDPDTLGGLLRAPAPPPGRRCRPRRGHLVWQDDGHLGGSGARDTQTGGRGRVPSVLGFPADSHGAPGDQRGHLGPHGHTYSLGPGAGSPRWWEGARRLEPGSGSALRTPWQGACSASSPWDLCSFHCLASVCPQFPRKFALGEIPAGLS